jgi:signal peptide peptidase-like protein 2B
VAASQDTDAFYGYPGPFGLRLNNTATPPMPLVKAAPLNACGGSVAAAPVLGAAALVVRGNCSFTDKAWALQRAGFGAMLLFNFEEGGRSPCHHCIERIVSSTFPPVPPVLGGA